MDNSIQEYLDCSNNMRHYSNHQAVLITAFIALNGGIAALVFGSETLGTPHYYLGAKIVAIAANILFSISIQNALNMWEHFFNRAITLETKIEFEQYNSLPGYLKYRTRPAKWAIQLSMVITIAFWILAILWNW